MGLNTNLNQSPYFDDFDETKNYHRVLFKPGVALQARELTQLQSILQNQIERFGDNILVEGTIIQGGNFIEESSLEYVKIRDIAKNPLGNEIATDINQYVGLKAVGASGVEGIIIYTIYGLETQSPNLNTLYIKYTKGAQDGLGNNVKRFSAGEELTLFAKDTNGDYTNHLYTVTIATTVVDNASGASPVGAGYGVRCGEGIIYQKGNFIRFEDALTIVSKYSTVPNGVVVGFQTEETLVTSDIDSSLLDNAEGFNNEKAPGADRLQLTPSLAVLTIDEARNDDTFFAIQEYANGKVVRRKLRTQYNQIEKEMERRTSEESGDYVVNRFDVYSAPDTTDPTKINAYIGPGLAYVDGMRVELINEIALPIADATTTANVVNQDISSNIGMYVTVSPTTANKPGRFDVTALETVNLVDGSAATIGTARIRAITKQSASSYRLYIFAVKMNSGKKFEDVRKIKSSTLNGDYTVTLISGAAKLEAETFNKVIFPLGKSFIKELSDADTSYIYEASRTTSFSGSTLTLTLTGSDEFPYSSGSLLPDNLLDLIIIATSADGTNITIGEALEITSASLDATRKILTINTTKTASVSVNVAVYFNARSTSVAGTQKTLTTAYVKVTANGNSGGVTGSYSLGMPDVYDIVGVWRGTSATSWATLETNATNNQTTNQVTSRFQLVKNDYDDRYGLSRVKKKGTITIGANDKLIFKVRTFTRGDGQFVSAKNYPVDDTSTVLPSDKIRTENIPTYTASDGTFFYLRDCIDLRPYATATANVATTASTASTDPSATEAYAAAKFPVPNKLIETAYSYYLGRNDIIVIDRNGEFQVINGTPAENPTFPPEPSKGMLLARLNVPPFPTLDSATATRIGKPAYGVSISSNQTQRYTMKDIAGIDKRIQSLEYYTALSLLENSAKDFQITDPTGANRFKNGIFVDNFSDLSLADVNGGEYNAANELYNITPSIRQYSLGLKYSTGTGIQRYKNSVVSLAKTDVAMSDVSQPYATALKNCTTSFYNYAGKIAIYPQYDSGPDTVKAPDIQLNIDLATPFVEFTEALSEFVPLTREQSVVIAQRRRSTTTQITTTQLQTSAGAVNSQDLGDFVTDVNFKPFMRSRDIQVKAIGLRPNTRFWFFFDGVDVTSSSVYKAVDYTGADSADSPQFVVAATATPGGSFISDSNGVLRAVFKIPADTFYVGDRKLEILDVNDLADKDAATSYASVTYSAFNMQVTKTGMSTKITSPKFESVVIDVRNETRSRGSDPIAQTFIVEPGSSSDTDVMLTKVDIFFARKSRAGNGVGIQICEVQNGIPTGVALPYSRVYKAASEVVASSTSIATNALNATTFVFDAPVAIKTGVEYAIMVAPDANDPDYLVWIARTGEADVDSGVRIVADTNAGVLFTSTNGKTWTPYQNENLKFIMYAAKFSSSTGTVTLTNEDHEFFTISDQTGTFVGDEQVFVKKTTGFANGTVAITTNSTDIVGTGTSFFSDYTADKHMVLTNGSSYKAYKIKQILSNTSIRLYAPIQTANTTGLSHYQSAVGKMQYLNQNDPATMILRESTAASTAQGNLIFANTNIVIGETSGAQCTISEVKSLQMSYIQPLIQRANFTKTGMGITADLWNGTTVVTGQSMAFGKTNYLTSDAFKIRSKSSLSPTSFKINLTLNNYSSTTRDTSPMLDYTISDVMIGEYQVNNLVNDSLELIGEGTSKTRYVTKLVQLAEGMDAEDIRVILGAYRPAGTNISVYARLQSGTDTRNPSSVEWTKLSIRPETDSSSSLANREDYREYDYQLSTTSKTAGQGAWSNSGTINYLDPAGALYTSFKYFAIKIVLSADSYNVVPRLRDLRVIAGT